MNEKEYSHESTRCWEVSKVKPILFTVLFLFLLTFWGLRATSNPMTDIDNDWDILVFTQQWPLTVCMEMKEKLRNFACRTSKIDIWTIHGIWPTKVDKLGPVFCKTPLRYNASQLISVVDILSVYWLDIDMKQTGDQFWRHEWAKHGVCALSFLPLNSPLKYFKQATTWSQQFNMKAVLENGGLLPDDSTSTNHMSILLAVEKVLGVKSSLKCIQNKNNGQYYLKEVMICFDKALQPTDCKGITLAQNTCSDNKAIFYPSTLPTQRLKR